MAYTEVSEYGYITGDQLELFSKLDYSTIETTQFSEVNVMGTVSIAERMVNSYLGKNGAQTVTDGIFTATTVIAAKLMAGAVAELGYDNEEQRIDLIDLSIRSILRMFLGTDVGVDSVPMSGADN